MTTYQKQVDKNAYNTGKYETIERFSSYFHQQRILGELISKLSEKKETISILEIGTGSAFLKNYICINYPNVQYKTLDFADDLKPDYLCSMTEIDSVVKEKFDIVCAFQVLEHVQYADAMATISKIGNITDNLIISLPYVRLYFSLRLKISALRALNFLLSLPFPMKHKFDGQHYWELGTKGYPLDGFRKNAGKEFNLVDEFSDNLNPWHRFFVLSKR
ncbi:MAG TPA: hypothetical protein DIC35_05245 [Candidatus Moranbacteria bacterium]|nr:hypothetical protein [Candidatus Moranbacteria bacterium]